MKLPDAPRNHRWRFTARSEAGPPLLELQRRRWTRRWTRVAATFIPLGADQWEAARQVLIEYQIRRGAGIG